MFTGIVQAIGKITSLRRQPAGVRLTVDRTGWQPHGLPIAPGDSICVSGVCLTVATCDTRFLEFDATAETLGRSTLSRTTARTEVNLEPALTAQTPMGGHFVQGHVDGLGTVMAVQQDAEDWRTRIQPPTDLLEYIVPKGSIAVDGVSLTVAKVDESSFEVALIPTTLGLTTLTKLAKGAAVNLEADIISKTVVHWLRLRSGGATDRSESDQPSLTMETLRRSGII